MQLQLQGVVTFRSLVYVGAAPKDLLVDISGDGCKAEDRGLQDLAVSEDS